MPPHPRRFPRALGALAVTAAIALVPATAFATRAQSSTPVPLAAWAATFCTSFAPYETAALAAQKQMQLAFAGVEDRTQGAAARTAIGETLTTAGAAAQSAASAARATGVPDLPNGSKLAEEIALTLVDTGETYAKVAAQSASFPTKPKALRAAITKAAKQLATALDPDTDHAKRLRKLDKGNKVAKAISSDPTCAASNPATSTTAPVATIPPAP
jgi:hypothetical protein